MINKLSVLLLLVPLLICCKENDKNNHALLINEIKLLNNKSYEINNILEKYNLKNPNDLKISDNNYYYLLSKIFYDKYNDNKYYSWFNYLINNAIASDNVFKKEALEIYVSYLSNTKNWILVKKAIVDNKYLLTGTEYEIYLKYVDDKSLNDLSYIPDNIKLLPLIYKIISSKPEDLKNIENQFKLENFIINTKIYYKLDENENDEDNNIDILAYKEYLNEILNYSENNYFLYCISNYLNKNTAQFNKNLENFLINTEQISFFKLETLKQLSIKLGQRKEFFKKISLYYNKNKYSKYFYGLEVIYFVNYNKGLLILKDCLSDFNLNSKINYNIRNIILNSTLMLNETWINEFIKYINDYPNSIYANNLFYTFLRRIMIYLNNESNIQLLKRFPTDKIGYKEKELFYYYLYLFDKKNSEEWKKNILKEFPLSFSAFRISNRNISIDNKNLIEKIKKETNLSLNAKIKFDKIQYLLEFGLINEAKDISLDDLNNNEKIIAYDCFYNHLIKSNDYFNSLKYMRSIIEILYDSNYYIIDDMDILIRLYPVPYQDLIFKYSEIHGIDPAYSFAVMREESNFKNDIVSYMSAVGLMQIMPATGKFISQKLNINNYDLTDPEDNINMGIYYLKFLHRYYDKKEYILACYNAGPGNAQRWFKNYKSYPDNIILELIPIYETKNYVRKVMQSYYIYDYLIKNQLNNLK